jgi:hypothetical protein
MTIIIFCSLSLNISFLIYVFYYILKIFFIIYLNKIHFFKLIIIFYKLINIILNKINFFYKINKFATVQAATKLAD